MQIETLDFLDVFSLNFKAENTKSFIVEHTVHEHDKEVNIWKKGENVNILLRN